MRSVDDALLIHRDGWFLVPGSRIDAAADRASDLLDRIEEQRQGTPY